MNKKSTLVWIILSALTGLFLLGSLFVGFRPGMDMGRAFLLRFFDMLKVLPFVFILLGQFEVWVSRAVVEKHFGERSGVMAYVWMLLLGGTTLGPMLVALPIARSLYDKGARISVVCTYLGAAAVCRIPMTMFEASYLGIKFTIIRYAVSIPLIILSSFALEKIAGHLPQKSLNDGN
ncbi:MAG: permease [Spirochaetales bacterium]|nr:permease [Spirochaetales bacterium]